MYLKKIIIDNFRNLDGCRFQLHPELNFVVGENNIGKSNFLDLLNTLFTRVKFKDSDFNDTEKPIKVFINIYLNDDEIGYFDDLFEPGDSNEICINAIQENIDEPIRYIHTTTGIPISTSKIKGLNFIYYSSVRNPIQELDFFNKKGAGKFLNFLIEKYFRDNKKNDLEYIKEEEVSNLIKYVNLQLEKMKTFNTFNINAFIDKESTNIMSRIVSLGDDSENKLSKLGDGVQFSLMILLVILEKLLDLKYGRYKNKFDSLTITKEDGSKNIPLIVGLDEPEIHMHSYMQRSLIKHIKSIILNYDTDFIDLLNDLFNIQGFSGQVITITHSPNIILDNYKQVIRLYKDDNKVCTKSGMDIEIQKDIEKHLLKSFLYIKEAFFSRGVIFVEGDTEFGAVPILAQKYGLDLDNIGFNVIKLEGADSVVKNINLLKEFGIPSIAIIDRDKKHKYEEIDNIYFTDREEFEDDIYDSFDFKDYLLFLKNYGEKVTFCIGEMKKLGIDFEPSKFNETLEDIIISEENNKILKAKFKETIISFLKADGVKNAITGRFLAEHVTEVPSSFCNALKAVERIVSYEE